MKVGLVYDSIYLKHDTGLHPENANRILAIMRYLERTGPWQQLLLIKPEAATKSELSLVHTVQYISEVQELAEKGGGQLDLDTVVSTDSYKTAIYAAGGVIKATDAVIGGNMHSVFALVTPPGHHAKASRGMGFCLFNNVAVAAKYTLIQHKLDRILLSISMSTTVTVHRMHFIMMLGCFTYQLINPHTIREQEKWTKQVKE